MEINEKHTQYIVVGGYYDNKTNAGKFIQALGAFDNKEQAYGVAILYLNRNIDDKKGEFVTPIYPLEGDTGIGMSVKHESYTDYAYVLFVEKGDTV